MECVIGIPERAVEVGHHEVDVHGLGQCQTQSGTSAEFGWSGRKQPCEASREFGCVSDDVCGAAFRENVCMCWGTVAPTGEADHAHASGYAGSDTGRAVFDHHASIRPGTERSRSVQEQVRGRLASFDLHCGEEMFEMAVQAGEGE